MQIYSFSPFGYEGALVTVEVDLRKGIPCVDIVGLADNAVKESRERMQAAIRNSGFGFPVERVLISLSPADLKKEGAGFDLPIALAVLAANNNSNESGGGLHLDADEPILIMGELELSGKVRAVRGVHAAASTAANGGILKCIVPSANADEAREVSGMRVFGADCLEDAFAALSNNESFTKHSDSFDRGDCAGEDFDEIEGVFFQKVGVDGKFSEMYGQKKLIRALQIAAAGRHNVIAVGAPGCGKTMAMMKFPFLMPLLTKEEAQSVTRITSLAGLLPPNKSLVRIPPFRMPHQTASIEGICGGGPNCRPGEVSLAHNGVLFLDEAAEFRTSVLQMLRVPIETGRVTLARAGRSTVYPASFQLLMAANPCPCGNFGSKTKICLCSTHSIEMYWKKFSGPLLDRIDLRVSVANEMKEEGRKVDKNATPISTDQLRVGIARAVKIQRERQGKHNSKLTPNEMAGMCKVNEASQKILCAAEERYNLSPRARASILKISRTIADMEQSENIQEAHIKEAIDFRKELTNFMDIENA